MNTSERMNRKLDVRVKGKQTKRFHPFQPEIYSISSRNTLSVTDLKLPRSIDAEGTVKSESSRQFAREN